ncbi:MAG: restriction endonuclease subunit M [Candidatus Taylorbacteria bacterium RIFCSPLOWO2_12_FULL_49_67]|nr:MAG: restriction endonuclease subunit M [Candidatus Taylorbacteria bacterium RIFCSPLOWO2_12_FULL_49_67]
MDPINHQHIVNFIWGIANLLRDDFKRAKYQDVILPLTVLRRLDCALEKTKLNVLKKHEQYKGKLEDTDGILKQASGYSFYNTSQYDFKKLLDDPKNIGKNLRLYINAYSPSMREIIEKFKFGTQIDALEEANLTFQIIEQFSTIDLHPDKVSNLAMGYVFEELIRKFNEASNENPGEHFTPREIIRLMVNLLFAGDLDILKKQRIIKTVYDPACGSGGMLTEAKEWILESVNKTAQIEMFGQEVNPETFAVAKSDFLIKGENAENIKFGSTLAHDKLFGQKFDYMLSNPPYGKEWKKEEKEIRKEAEIGFQGRFGAGLPRISDGQLLFLQTMLAKMRPSNGGSRIAIVMNGSPLFTGDAGSGESEIRRWIIENDWLEAIVALPNQLFYNTGIHTYIWILTNRKKAHHKRNIKLINAVELYEKMRKSLGDKRNYISDEQIKKITEAVLDGEKPGFVQIHPNEFFGYRKITIERPLKLNFQASAERTEKLKVEAAFQNLAKSKKRDPIKKADEEKAGRTLQKKIVSALSGIGDTLYKNQDKFIKVLDIAFKKVDLALDAATKKAVLNGLSERDETADIITDKKGNPEPDVDLRDYENVPLGEDIRKYFKREVLPHVPDAWISEESKYRDHKDGEIGKVGYEISFTRYFYEYKPLRPLEKISAEIKTLEDEISGTLKDL